MTKLSLPHFAFLPPRRHGGSVAGASELDRPWGGAVHPSPRRSATAKERCLALSLVLAAMQLGTLALGTPATAVHAQESKAQSAPAPGAGTRPLNHYQGPPDGEDEHGYYYLISYPLAELGKEGIGYTIVGENHDFLRFGIGLSLMIDHRTDDAIVARYYPSRQYKVDPPVTEEFQYAPVPEVVTADRLELRAWDEGLPRQGQWRQQVFVVDLDGDGRLDLVHGPPRKSQPPVPVAFLNHGDGTWSQWPMTFDDHRLDYGSIVAADFDNDGHLDLGLAMHVTGTLLFHGDGGGNFTTVDSGLGFLPVGTSPMKRRTAFSSRSLAVGDLDLDGRVDLVSLGEGMSNVQMGNPALSAGLAPVPPLGPVVYWNRADGWEEDHFDRDTDNFGDKVRLGDLDGDGRLDILTSSSSIGEKRLVYLNKEDGFQSQPIAPLRERAFVFGVATRKADHGKRLEALLGYLAPHERGMAGFAARFALDESGNWQGGDIYYEQGIAGIHSIAAGDVDGDGRDDVVMGTGDGRVLLMLADADGGFTLEAQELLPAAKSCTVYDVETADLNGDGKSEIIAGLAGESTGFTGLVSEPGCDGGGSLRVWTAAVKSDGQTSSAKGESSASGTESGSSR